MSDARTWDIGDSQPEGVTIVRDYSWEGYEVGDPDQPEWHLTVRGSEWKGYKGGFKAYLDWPELVRRWGPVTEVVR